MSARFVADEGVTLSAYELADARAGATLPPRLLPPARSGGPERVIAFAARDADGRFLGRVAIEGVDWIARRARVTARWGSETALAPAALRLAARCARRDLNLDALEAEPADEAWREVLREAGFQGGGLLVATLRETP